MTWLLPEGAALRFEGLDQPVRILQALGGGTQGQVYAVAVGGECLASSSDDAGANGGYVGEWWLCWCTVARDRRRRWCCCWTQKLLQKKIIIASVEKLSHTHVHSLSLFLSFSE